MKNIVLFAAIGAVCLISAGWAETSAQRSVQPGGLKIDRARVQYDGTSLDIAFMVDYAGLSLSTQQQLRLQPVVVAGRDTAYLPYLLLAGKSRDKMNHRRDALYGPKAGQEASGLYRAVRVGGGGRPEAIYYTASVPFREWMPGARLEVMQILSGCADCLQKLPSLRIGSAEKPRVELPPPAAFLRPGVDTVKMRKERREAFLISRKAGRFSRQSRPVTPPDFER